MTRNRRIVVGLTTLIIGAGLGYAVRSARAAGIPATKALSYSGTLEDSGGPVTGTHNVQVTLYDAATAGNQLCQAASAPIAIASGRFTVLLPDACTTAAGANQNIWVDVFVDGADTGRTPIGAVPYAVEANHAVKADTATAATNASTAQAAGGALQTSISQMQSAIATLQAAPAPLTTVVGESLNTTDPSSASWQGFATQCIAADTGGGATLIDACLVAASRKCSGLGYKMGLPTGELSAGSVGIYCVK
jgi:hypothetical protein